MLAVHRFHGMLSVPLNWNVRAIHIFCGTRLPAVIRYMLEIHRFHCAFTVPLHPILLAIHSLWFTNICLKSTESVVRLLITEICLQLTVSGVNVPQACSDIYLQSMYFIVCSLPPFATMCSPFTASSPQTSTHSAWIPWYIYCSLESTCHSRILPWCVSPSCSRIHTCDSHIPWYVHCCSSWKYAYTSHILQYMFLWYVLSIHRFCGTFPSIHWMWFRLIDSMVQVSQIYACDSCTS